MSLRTALTRLPMSKVYTMAHPRMLSVQGGSAVRKLQQVMEEYRMQK
jgi:hypothetical protein